MEITDKNILVVGLGMSGAATARFLKNRGAAVTVTDMAPEADLENDAREMRKLDISLELGHHRIETFQNADLIVVSPGVPHTIPPLNAAREKGIPVIGEIELASRFIQEPIAAVTGTNGKTTTTTLLGQMLEASGLRVFVGGNIGNPLISYVDNQIKSDVVVAEVSSFQLDTIDTFRPRAAVLLNITEDHLDRYPDFTAYAKSKARVFENQKADDFAILNNNDPMVRSVTQNIKSKKLNIGNLKVKNRKFSVSCFAFRVPSLEFQLPHTLAGQHNVENAASACLAALVAGGTPHGIQIALDNFRGLPHRIEYVTTIKDVMFFNDSKATNPDATLKAIECFENPVILIMGGRGKGNHFEVLKPLVHERVKKLILMGETADELKSALGNESRLGCSLASGMEESVSQAFDASAPGDVVLLSPACASFDMYQSYKERGNHFVQCVSGS